MIDGTMGLLGVVLAGSLLLGASLFVKKHAGWWALTGSILLLAVAVREVDPALGLGVLVLNGIRLLRIAPDGRAGQDAFPGPTADEAGLDRDGLPDARRNRP